MTPAEFERLRNPPANPNQSRIGEGSTVQDRGNQQPRSATANAQQSNRESFSVPGVEGTASVQRGSGNNELARQNLSRRIAADSAAGFQRAANRIQLEDEARARARSGVGAGNRGGSAPIQGALSRIAEQRSQLQQQITQGMSGVGPQLTASGLRGLTSQLNNLNSAEADLIGEVSATQRNAANNQTTLENRRLTNQGQLANTALRGENRLANTQAQINDPFNQARADALNRGVGQIEVDDNFPTIDEVLEATQGMDPETRQQVFARYEAERQTRSDAADLAADFGGDIRLAIENINEELNSMREDPNADPQEFENMQAIKARLSTMAESTFRFSQPQDQQQGVLQNLPNNSPQNSVGNQDILTPLGFENGGLVPQLDSIMNFADGGLVPPQGGVGSAGQAPGGGGIGGQPLGGGGLGDGQQIPGIGASIQQYQKYLQTAQEMGIDPVGFEEFAQLSSAQPPGVGGGNGGGPPAPELQPNANASRNIIGLADGGIVPGSQGALEQLGQVDGQQVIDPNQNAPTDSIPAVIDGQQPAALDSGEFVMPADVVMHFGTDKLQKMIEAARNKGGQQGGAQQSGGQPSG